MKPEYKVIIYTPQELNHSSYVQTGLFELERLGIIEVKVTLSTSKKLGRIFVSKDGELKRTNQPFPKTSYYRLINKNTKEYLFIATDLYDSASQFSTFALEECDVVFKRNYESELIKYLPKNYHEKIHCLGMSFGVHSNFKRHDYLFFMGLIISNLKINAKIDRLFFKRLSRTYSAQLNHWKFINTSRKLERFVNFVKPNKNTILFQTRCFLHEDQEDVIDIHQQRYHLIKLLKNHFPNLFMGGFIPSGVAVEKYGNALSNVPSDPELYLDTLKNADIVIYTRGLANSPAWKMAEYLSQGKVIMAEQLTTELPVPLLHGKEVLFFNSDEELIKNIQLVLSDTRLADNLSKYARIYFEKYVHPAKNVKRILDFMIANFKNKS